MKLLPGLSLLLLFTGVASANIINVPDDRPTIQEGINAATGASDTVLVQPGTYVENINFGGRNIVVGSLFVTTQDTSYISRTVIDGNQSGSVVTFNNGEDSTAVLNGFSLINGSATSGGGILCRLSSNPSLENLVINGNTAEFGGGIICNNSNPSLKNVRISENIAKDSGGGIYCVNSNASLTNVTINGNTSDFESGGMFCVNSSPRLVNVTISENIAQDFGGGIYCHDFSHPILVNTILWNNLPQEVFFFGSTDSISIIIAYSDVQGGENKIVTNNKGTVNWLEGNIDVDPMFVDVENGNFQLQKGSPCIDAGTAFFVLDEDTLINLSQENYSGSEPDMGAFEYMGLTYVENMDTPVQFSLCQNYPNPFNPNTTIEFTVPEAGFTELAVYNMAGQKIRELVSADMTPGVYSVVWDGRDEKGTPGSSGVYISRLKAGDNVFSNRMMLVK